MAPDATAVRYCLLAFVLLMGQMPGYSSASLSIDVEKS